MLFAHGGWFMKEGGDTRQYHFLAQTQQYIDKYQHILHKNTIMEHVANLFICSRVAYSWKAILQELNMNAIEVQESNLKCI